MNFPWWNKPTPEPEHELLTQVIRSMENEPDSWNERWTHNSDVYAFNLEHEGNIFLAHVDGQLRITCQGHKLSEPNDPSTGTLNVVLSSKEKKQIIASVAKLGREKALRFLERRELAQK